MLVPCQKDPMIKEIIRCFVYEVSLTLGIFLFRQFFKIQSRPGSVIHVVEHKHEALSSSMQKKILASELSNDVLLLETIWIFR
jgi:hypothetical protein